MARISTKLRYEIEKDNLQKFEEHLDCIKCESYGEKCLDNQEEKENIQETFRQDFFRNSEESASEFLENLK